MHETKLIFPYFLDQTLRLLFISLLVLYSYYSRAATIRGRLLFKGGVYFLGKPGDINNSWIRYVRVRR